MRANRGFTMLELATVVGIVGILAALAVPMVRAARRNAMVQGVGFELKVFLEGLRARALRDQRDLVAIVVDAAGNDPTNCVREGCAAYYLVEPAAGFRLNAFNPAVTPYANLGARGLISSEHLGKGAKFYRPALVPPPRFAPAPFAAVAAFDPDLVGNCGPARCVGIRFRRDGTVDAEWPDGVPGPQKLGVAFVIGSDADVDSAGSNQRGVVVSFPAGIIRAYPVAR